jgi:hypothetical protein
VNRVVLKTETNEQSVKHTNQYVTFNSVFTQILHAPE